MKSRWIRSAACEVSSRAIDRSASPLIVPCTSYCIDGTMSALTVAVGLTARTRSSTRSSSASCFSTVATDWRTTTPFRHSHQSGGRGPIHGWRSSSTSPWIPVTSASSILMSHRSSSNMSAVRLLLLAHSSRSSLAKGSTCSSHHPSGIRLATSAKPQSVGSARSTGTCASPIAGKRITSRIELGRQEHDEPVDAHAEAARRRHSVRKRVDVVGSPCSASSSAGSLGACRKRGPVPRRR